MCSHSCFCQNVLPIMFSHRICCQLYIFFRMCCQSRLPRICCQSGVFPQNVLSIRFVFFPENLLSIRFFLPKQSWFFQECAINHVPRCAISHIFPTEVAPSNIFFRECAAIHVFPTECAANYVFFPRMCYNSCSFPRMCCQSCFFPKNVLSIMFFPRMRCQSCFLPEGAANLVFGSVLSIRICCSQNALSIIFFFQNVLLIMLFYPRMC